MSSSTLPAKLFSVLSDFRLLFLDKYSIVLSWVLGSVVGGDVENPGGLLPVLDPQSMPKHVLSCIARIATASCITWSVSLARQFIARLSSLPEQHPEIGSMAEKDMHICPRWRTSPSDSSGKKPGVRSLPCTLHRSRRRRPLNPDTSVTGIVLVVRICNKGCDIPAGSL